MIRPGAHIIRAGSFYLGLALLFTHEMDAMSNHEWRVLPLLNLLEDATGRSAFLLAHVPIFAVVIAFVASLNRRVRERAWAVASGFLILHALLHLLFSGSADYEFSTGISSLLIYGAALCGLVYFFSLWLASSGTRPRRRSGHLE